MRITSIVLMGSMLPGCWTDGQKDELHARLKQLRSSTDAAVPFGDGRVHLSLENTNYQPPQTKIYKTERVKGPMPTNDWWSSIAWRPYSGALYPHPIAAKA
jgi:endoglucanase Acf2